MCTHFFPALLAGSLLFAGAALPAAAQSGTISISLSRPDAGLKIKSGEKLAFLGDSITQLGNHYPCGYLYLVIDGFRRSGVEVGMIPAGISGHKSNNMLARVDGDVIRKKPAWMTLSCGVNDVWHGANGVPLEDYKKNITAICDKVQAAGIKIMILTATMIGEDAENENNRKLIPYNEFLRAFAKERGYVLVDLNDIMQKEIAAERKAHPTPGQVNRRTYDGVHMAKSGHIMIAAAILAGFGMPADEIAKYKAVWQDYPENTHLDMSFTVEEWKQLEAAAKKQNASVPAMAKKVLLDAAGK